MFDGDFRARKKHAPCPQFSGRKGCRDVVTKRIETASSVRCMSAHWGVYDQSGAIACPKSFSSGAGRIPPREIGNGNKIRIYTWQLVARVFIPDWISKNMLDYCVEQSYTSVKYPDGSFLPLLGVLSMSNLKEVGDNFTPGFFCFTYSCVFQKDVTSPRFGRKRR